MVKSLKLKWLSQLTQSRCTSLSDTGPDFLVLPANDDDGESGATTCGKGLSIMSWRRPLSCCVICNSLNRNGLANAGTEKKRPSSSVGCSRGTSFTSFVPLTRA